MGGHKQLWPFHPEARKSPALTAQDFHTCPPAIRPHLDVFVGRRFLVILFVFLKLPQFFLCLQLFKSYCSFLKS